MKFKTKVKDLRNNLSLEEIEESLKNDFPELTYFYRKNLTGRHLIVKETNAVGLGIYSKNNEVKIIPVYPSMKLVFLLGAAAPFILSFKKKERAALKEKLSLCLLSKYGEV